MSQPSPIREYNIAAKTTDTFGRVLCAVREHHFIIDGPVQNGCPGEEITPAEAFLSGVGACGVELVEVIARDENVKLRGVSVSIYGKVDRSNQKRPDVTVFNEVRLKVHVTGTDQATAARLVDGFTKRCPLYGTVRTAVENVSVEVTASS